jgi:hypothetical protein
MPKFASLLLLIFAYFFVPEAESFRLENPRRCPVDGPTKLFPNTKLNVASTDSDVDGLKTPFAERIESVKSAAVAAVGGSLLVLPISVFKGIVLHFDGQWEFSIDMLAISLALFGITYRYAIRKDSNPNLKQGVVGAFAITRTLPFIQVPVDQCTTIPLDCGPPFHYLSWGMIQHGGLAFAYSFLAFTAAAYVMERAFDRGFISKFPSSQ